jgi:hypothetical protein
VATQSMHDAVMAEFGDSHADGGNVWQEMAVAVDPDMPAEATGDGFELGEMSRPQVAKISLEV